MRVLQIAAGVVISIGAIGFAELVQAQQLSFEGDMVRGRDRNLGASGPTCVLTSQFKRQEHVVWRVRIVGDGGENLGEDAIDSVEVEIPSGEKFEMEFGTHPRREPTDSFWATSWQVPADYPTGSIGYKVVAVDKAGNSHEWQPFNVANSKLTVIPGDVTWEK